MAFSDYSTNPASNTTIGDAIYIGPNMARNDVREALQQLAADGKVLDTEVSSIGQDILAEAEEAAAVAVAAALTAPNVYASTAAGLAAVGANETFWVYASGNLSLYRDVAGVAVLLDSLPLSTAVLAHRSFGDATAKDIPVVLTDTPLEDNEPAIFVGLTSDTGNALNAYADATFPPGIGFGRMGGTFAAPTMLASGNQWQIGFIDHYTWVDGNMLLVASEDIITNSGIAWTSADRPATIKRTFLSDGTDMEEVGRFVGGQGLELGSVVGVGEDAVYYAPRGSASPRVYAVMHESEWTAIFDSRYAGGTALGVRVDLSRNTNSDYFAAFTYDGTIVSSIRGDGMGIFPRMRLGREDDPVFGAPTLAIQNTINDYCFTAESRPASGAGYAARFHTLGETASDFIFMGTSGAGSGSIKFSVLSNGVVNALTEYRVNGTKVVGAQGAAVADATDAATVITQLNALLARLRTHGLIAA